MGARVEVGPVASRGRETDLQAHIEQTRELCGPWMQNPCSLGPQPRTETRMGVAEAMSQQKNDSY